MCCGFQLHASQHNELDSSLSSEQLPGRVPALIDRGPDVDGAATLTSVFGLNVLRQIEGLRWHICQRQVEIVGQKPDLSRAIVAEELQKLGAALTDLEADNNIAENQLRLIFNVRLPNEHAIEPMMTKLEALPGIRSLKVERTG